MRLRRSAPGRRVRRSPSHFLLFEVDAGPVAVSAEHAQDGLVALLTSSLDLILTGKMLDDQARLLAEWTSASFATFAELAPTV